MSLTLSAAINQCPKSLFGKAGKNPPDYPGILAVVAKALLTDAKVKFDEKTVDAMAAVINPSTMQRMIAKRREGITGKIGKDGEYEPLPEPKAAKAAKPAAPVKSKKAQKLAALVAKKEAKAAKKASKPAAVPEPKAAKKGKKGKKSIKPAKAAKPAAPAPVAVDDDDVI